MGNTILQRPRITQPAVTLAARSRSSHSLVGDDARAVDASPLHTADCFCGSSRLDAARLDSELEATALAGHLHQFVHCSVSVFERNTRRRLSQATGGEPSRAPGAPTSSHGSGLPHHVSRPSDRRHACSTRRVPNASQHGPRPRPTGRILSRQHCEVAIIRLHTWPAYRDYEPVPA